MSTKPPSSSIFLDRELSVLAFNWRVLLQAENKNIPILERLRFLCIVSNNLDEFFMVRVAGIRAQVREGIAERSPDGLTPTEQLKLINETVSQLAIDQQAIWRDLRKFLGELGIVLVEPRKVSVRFDRTVTTASGVAAALMNQLEVKDFSLSEPDLASIIKQIYNGALSEEQAAEIADLMRRHAPGSPSR